MSDPGFPVTVPVARADGRVEHVRVGTAYRDGEGFTLRLGDLAIGSTPDAASQQAAPRQTPIGASGGGGITLPNYGRSKNAPVAGASMQDLEYYANGCRRTLSDESKARWHDKERTLLAAIEAEITRQRGGVAPMSDAGPPDEDIPF
ncbi:MAG: hypothetical protein EXR72_25335 [Myxococcales bacterium]|nr:hypothetical protein [Myxococcales bacterium]